MGSRRNVRLTALTGDGAHPFPAIQMWSASCEAAPLAKASGGKARGPDRSHLHPWNFRVLPRQRSGAPAGGEIAAAAQEERFTRKKGDASSPRHAVKSCLRAAGIGVSDLGYVGFYDKPLVKFDRILETYLAERFLRYWVVGGPVAPGVAAFVPPRGI